VRAGWRGTTDPVTGSERKHSIWRRSGNEACSKNYRSADSRRLFHLSFATGEFEAGMEQF
jgi:hypothetical protein